MKNHTVCRSFVQKLLKHSLYFDNISEDIQRNAQQELPLAKGNSSNIFTVSLANRFPT